MPFNFERPPERLTWYHLNPMLDADAGTLTYDHTTYRNHGISNNALACHWCGLLASGPDGMVLTDLGRTMLADWKTSPAGIAWLAEQAAMDAGKDPADEPAPTPAEPPQAAPAPAEQLDLF